MPFHNYGNDTLTIGMPLVMGHHQAIHASFFLGDHLRAVLCVVSSSHQRKDNY
jgi:hypothetical protein